MARLDERSSSINSNFTKSSPTLWIMRHFASYSPGRILWRVRALVLKQSRGVRPVLSFSRVIGTVVRLSETNRENMSAITITVQLLLKTLRKTHSALEAW